MRLIKQALIASCCVAVTGCASISGYDSTSDFSCAAPDGVSCESVAGVYANARAKNLPSQQPKVKHDASIPGDGYEGDYTYPKEKIVVVRKISGQASKTGQPIYRQPKIVRIWFAPYEDANHILHDQSYSYLTIQKGYWDLEHLDESLEKSSQAYTINGQ